MEPHVLAALRGVLDPEFGLNVVDLGLIYALDETPDGLLVKMTLTTPSCPLHDTIVGEVKRAVETAAGRPARVELVWQPAWTPDRISLVGLAQLNT